MIEQQPAAPLWGEYSVRRVAPFMWVWRALPSPGGAPVGGVALTKEQAKRSAEREIAKRKPSSAA